jgi:uncharacterized protein (TIGR02246 family)
MPIPQSVSIQAATAAIAELRRAWLDAVTNADADRLASMVTEDVVVVHGDGRSLHGKVNFREDFLRGFAAFSIEQRTSPVEILLHGRWAFDVADVETRLTPRKGGESHQVRSTTVTALHQQPDGSWKVARVLGLLD